MAALLVVAIGHAMSPPRPCRARLRLHAQTVSQAGSMLPEFPTSSLPCEKVHLYYLSPYSQRRPLDGFPLQVSSQFRLIEKVMADFHLAIEKNEHPFAVPGLQ